MIALEVDPAVLRDPDARHVQMPQLARAGEVEEPRTASVRLTLAALDQAVFAHDPQQRLATRREPGLADDPRGHQAIAVGRVRLRDLHDRPLNSVLALRRRCRNV